MNDFVMQKTIATSFMVEGKGLHTGEEVRVTLFPAAEDTGIVFQVIQSFRETLIPARFEFVAEGVRCTALEKDGITLLTPEHLLAACWGAGISNLCVQVQGRELPGGDGSAWMWWEILQRVGIKVQEAQQPIFPISRVIGIEVGKQSLFAFPAERIQVIYLLDSTSHGDFAQVVQFKEGEDFTSVARARTFAFEWEVENIIEKDLGLGVRNEALVFGRNGSSNRLLRVPHEAGLHKILDLLGDLMLFGPRVCGGFLGIRSGHRLNRLMIERLRREAQDYAN